MLTEDDLEWYSDLLSSAICGIANIGISEAMRIGRCGKAAAGDKRLYYKVMQKTAIKYPKQFVTA